MVDSLRILNAHDICEGGNRVSIDCCKGLFILPIDLLGLLRI